MKYVQINSVPNLSTGNVMMQIKAEREKAGDECWCIWGRGRGAENDHEYNFGSKPEFYWDVLQTRLDGKTGFHSKAATRRLLKKLDEIEPDVVHLHNIHGYYVNVEMLFAWLASHDCQVKWTLHDCWAFTGHCAHFSRVGCNQWRSECGCTSSCPLVSEYPKTYSGRSIAWNYASKKNAFCSLPPHRFSILTPSAWLARLVKSSFLGLYSVQVCRNKIDTGVYRPTASDFRALYDLEDKFVILGVASTWTSRKGLDDFLQLSRDLDNNFAIVMAGLTQAQIKQYKEVIGLPKLEPRELARVYTSADVLFYPTQEDNYPSSILEAEACGTPVLTYDVGGCAECLTDSHSRAIASSLTTAEDIIREMYSASTLSG